MSSEYSKMTKLYDKQKVMYFPATINDSLVPNEVEAQVKFGDRVIYVLAPITRVDRVNNKIQIYLIGEIGDDILVSFPGEVENAGSTIQVNASIINGG